MKELPGISEVLEIEQLENEYDLERASILERKLRLMIKENPGLKPKREKLRKLIADYEQREWSEFDKISDSKFEESDLAEKLVNQEQEFIQKRKDAIRKKLKEFDMNQQDLGVLLGHSKSYISELINGVSQFTLKDLVIIHRVLDLSLSTLIPTYLQFETQYKVNESITKLNKPKLKFKQSMIS